jgi:hypothetical protein
MSESNQLASSKPKDIVKICKLSEQIDELNLKDIIDNFESDNNEDYT